MFKMPDIKVESIIDVDKFQFIEKSILHSQLLW